MTINQKAEQLKYLTELIDKERTGCANELARCIGISRSKLFELIDEFKTFGVDIQYNRRKNSFFYANNRRIEINIPITVINQHECRTTNGGFHQNSLSVHFSGLCSN